MTTVAVVLAGATAEEQDGRQASTHVSPPHQESTSTTSNGQLQPALFVFSSTDGDMAYAACPCPGREWRIPWAAITLVQIQIVLLWTHRILSRSRSAASHINTIRRSHVKGRPVRRNTIDTRPPPLQSRNVYSEESSITIPYCADIDLIPSYQGPN